MYPQLKRSLATRAVAELRLVRPMSSRDYQRHHAQLSALRGRKAFATLATNSIKLHIDANKKEGTYLWIDPPWEFYRENVLVGSSASCPDHTLPDYDARCVSRLISSVPFTIPLLQTRPLRPMARSRFGSSVEASFSFLQTRRKEICGMITGITKTVQRPNQAMQPTAGRSNANL